MAETEQRNISIVIKNLRRFCKEEYRTRYKYPIILYKEKTLKIKCFQRLLAFYVTCNRNLYCFHDCIVSFKNIETHWIAGSVLCIRRL